MPNEPGRRYPDSVPPFATMFRSDPQAGEALENWLKKLLYGIVGTPTPHAKTHMGVIGQPLANLFGGDGLVSEDTPQPVTFGIAGSAGDPTTGVPASDHVHELDLQGLEKLLLAFKNGILQISDEKTRDLLEGLLLDLKELQDLLLGAETAAEADRSVVLSLDGGGSPISTGQKGFIACPFAGTIKRWTLVADQSGSIVIDVWKTSYLAAPPTVADTIAGAEKPTLAAAQKNEDASLSSWKTPVLAGDVFGFNVDSAATVTRANLVVWISPA